ncbi:hypothetical protein YC2023_044638 [Brassica napus]
MGIGGQLSLRFGNHHPHKHVQLLRRPNKLMQIRNSKTTTLKFIGQIFQWLPSSSTNLKVRTICNLLVQAIVYALWKERNLRLHTSSSRHSLLLVKEVKVILKAKLFGLDRSPPGRSLQQSTSSSETYLHEWFHHFDSYVPERVWLEFKERLVCLGESFSEEQHSTLLGGPTSSHDLTWRLIDTCLVPIRLS